MPNLEAILSLKNAAFKTGLQESKAQARAFAEETSSMISGMIAGGAVAESFRELVEKAHTLENLGERFHTATDGLQRIGNAAKEDGVDLEAVAKGLSTIEKNAQTAASGGNAKLLKVFNDIGISTEELRSLNGEQLFLRLADAMASGALKGRDFEIANDLLGKSYAALLPTLQRGSEGIKKAGDELNVLSAEQVEHFAQFHHQLQVFQGGLQTLEAWILNFAFKTMSAVGAFAADWVDAFEIMGSAANKLMHGDFKGAWAKAKETNNINMYKDVTAAWDGDPVESPHGGTADGADAPGESKAQEKGEDQELDFENRLADLKRRNALEALKPEERLLALARDRFELETALAAARVASAKTANEDEKKLYDLAMRKIEQGILANEEEKEAAERELKRDQTKDEKKEDRDFKRDEKDLFGTADELQRIGGNQTGARYGGDTIAIDHLNIAKQTLEVQQKILTAVSHPASASGGGGAGMPMATFGNVNL